MLYIKNLCKSYHHQLVLDNINVSAKSGEIIGLVGVNGSGKTTLMKCIANLTKDYTGDIECEGKVAFSIESPTFYKHLTTKNNLEIFRSLSNDNKKNHINIVLDKVGLHNVEKKKVSELSLGMKQKLAIARMLLTDNAIILLDEPFNGLDYITKVQIRDIILNLKNEGKIVIVSSHILEELGEICDSIWYLNDGKLRSHINLHDSKRLYTIKTIYVEEIDENIIQHFGLKQYESSNGYITYKMEIETSKVADTLKALIDNGFKIIEYFDSTNNILDILLDKENANGN